MEADFSGWATKAGLRCSDGRTIMPDAFKNQDKVRVPLVWQHGHNDPENVLGHAMLYNRPEGVWCEGFFNDTPKAQHAKTLVVHKDINSLSIWANQLIEQSKRVMHGVIREVSLVLSGANPGALIENVTVRHGDGEFDTLDDEAIIYTGLSLMHADGGSGDGGDGGDDETIQDVYDSMSEKQKKVLHYMIGEALASADDNASHSDMELDDDATIADVYETMNDQQKQILHYMIGEALDEAAVAHSNNGDANNQEGNDMRNVFEQGDTATKESTSLSHDAMKGIFEEAKKTGSLKEAVKAYAEEHLSHGIEDIDTLFPEARNLTDAPELFGRRVEWVASLLNGVRKSPFSRIRTLSADITVAEARAKGYVKGTLKKEEFFAVKGRITTPTTIYKKQKLDRDDIVDITDFDVVVWLKGEMRLMLDEELARAILIGDGRAVDDEDKIDENCIRPIATDHELYTTTVNVNIGDSSSSFSEVIDGIVSNRRYLRGTGQPTMYTTEAYIAQAMLLRDGVGRRLYPTLDVLANELRVKEIVPVEVMEEDPTIVAILVNPIDYVVGATAGGQVNMFDDFDIDYNQYKYLIETRCCGALVKLKAALVVRAVPADDELVVPAEPEFDGSGVTITNQTGVVYRNAATDAVMNAAGSPYAVAEGETITVKAEADSGYYFGSSNDDEWTYTGQA